MTNVAQMDLLDRAMNAIHCVNKNIGVMADVVQQSAIGNMTAMATMFRGIKGGASVASALTSVATNASSLTSTTLPPVIVTSQAEKFLNKRHCFVCNRKLGRDKSKDECRGIRDPTCPLKGDPAVVERGKFKEAEFKAWKSANPDSRKPRKKKPQKYLNRP